MSSFFPMMATLALVLALAKEGCTTHDEQDPAPATVDAMKAHTNRLAQESSPYLLQHAHNPVDWYPWGEEAFAKARAENKLVLISIGYSSCHWCHVMERESFEDEAIAGVMNERFVCIKVDREERPDVDQVYMTAVQLMGGRGGWPLNCFALPDGRPVYGGTYYPPQQWTAILTDLDGKWRSEPDRVIQYADKLTEGVISNSLIQTKKDPDALDKELFNPFVANWERQFDRVHGGPDKAPKFPMPNNYEFLLRYAFLTGDKDLRSHVELTLDRMALGGINDQVGGGFSRYSTDVLWKVPHFEKMLYDNAQLVSLYSRAFQAFGKPLYKETVERTLSFIAREMTGPDGEFHSALDADSEGVEGKFYVWTKEELMHVLGVEYDLAAAYFNVDKLGLWEHGNHILLRRMDDPAFANSFGIAQDELKERIAGIRAKLLDTREKRTRPGLDTKALTSWNALMVKGYCDAYDVFGEKAWLKAAIRNMEHLLTHCRRTDGGLWHNYHASTGTGPGKASINGYLEDHCFTMEALLALYQVTFDERWVTEAQALAEHAIRHFLDEASGTFYFNSDLDPPLITRPREMLDNVIPSSNSSMARGLFTLGTLLDNERYLELSARLLDHVVGTMADYPSGYSNWAQLLLEHTYPLPEIAITGPEALELRRAFAAYYLPNKLFLGGTVSGSLPLLKDKFLPSSTIFVCVEKSCRLPVPTVKEAISQLP